MPTRKTASKTSKPRSRATAPAKSEAEKSANSSATGASKKSIYYVVYVDSYVSDTEILARGIYLTDKKVERLDQSQSQYVKKFEGTVPDKIVHALAEQLKISVSDEKGNHRSTQDILDEMVSVI